MNCLALKTVFVDKLQRRTQAMRVRHIIGMWLDVTTRNSWKIVGWIFLYFLFVGQYVIWEEQCITFILFHWVSFSPTLNSDARSIKLQYQSRQIAVNTRNTFWIHEMYNQSQWEEITWTSNIESCNSFKTLQWHGSNLLKCLSDRNSFKINGFHLLYLNHFYSKFYSQFFLTNTFCRIIID